MHENFDMRKGRVFAEWFKGSKTNVCYNALDRWVEKGRGQQVNFYNCSKTIETIGSYGFYTYCLPMISFEES